MQQVTADCRAFTHANMQALMLRIRLCYPLYSLASFHSDSSLTLAQNCLKTRSGILIFVSVWARFTFLVSGGDLSSFLPAIWLENGLDSARGDGVFFEIHVLTRLRVPSKTGGWGGVAMSVINTTADTWPGPLLNAADPPGDVKLRARNEKANRQRDTSKGR